MTNETAAVTAARLTKTFDSGDTLVRALDGVSVEFRPRRFSAIMGPSGSGKSTLMHCLAGLDRPGDGEVMLGGTSLWTLDDDALTEVRRDRIGFIFQGFNLLPTLTAYENITLPFVLAGKRGDPDIVDAVVDALGLGERLHHRPSQLSGGQQQRVACARALVTEPDVVFADEPTGALDSRSSRELLAFLRHGVDALGRTVVMVTHDPVAAGYADEVLFLADGRIVDTMSDPTAETVLDHMKALEEVAV
ncbi:ABC transporter ATP-binding protein [Stackebrandtia nassauensis]|uniref:ABC transporter related protein n=1 Tax=Stackebrandtia nassauensis (strain DSM 44728 / CIP 108903 / NRRL B-16338 / NBRC 102104 / LLR-40K-21) TaxID=446470 RepID=D3PZA7_STANL|nr:ABC transporter ATP-binding protein [Stackebrandtia nassauensis]ADD41581.1 ABC transporter related protein [Stackebrandtia nassauensis DSM 44728]